MQPLGAKEQAGAPKPVAVAAFDFDGTLTRGDTLLPYLRRSLGWLGFVRSLLLSAPWLLAFALRLISNERAKARLLCVSVAGRTVQEVKAWTDAFVADYLPHQWRADARARLTGYQQSGQLCVVVSASTSLYMHAVGAALGVAHVLCTEMEVVQGRYTGRLQSPNCYGPEKVSRLQAWMAQQGLSPAAVHLSAFGDSAGDHAMLALAQEAWYRGQPWQGARAGRMTTPVRGLLGALFALHFVVGALIGLSADEAHYALYAANLALSYFDHPPMVGWVQWPLVALNAPDAVLRLIPGLLWLGMAVLVYRLARRLQPPRADAGAAGDAGLWAVAALALAPLPHVLGIGLLPDTLLMLLTPLLMGLTLDLMEGTDTRRIPPWVALGVCLGLCGLSKYTAAFGALAVAGCLLRVHGVRLLWQAGVWIACALALILILPVLVWNAQHDWVSLAYQAHHGKGGSWTAVHLLQFLVVQLFAFGPLLLWGGAGVRRTAKPQQAWLALFFAVPFAILAYMAGGGSSLPHWTTPSWVALAPFAGLALAAAWQRGRRWGLRLLVGVQALACAGLMALMVSGGAPLVGGPNNPFADLHGWEAAAERAGVLARQHQLSSVSVQNWTLASRIGWYARPLPVHVLDSGFSQFDLWAGALPAGADSLLVDWSNMAFELPIGEHGFADCQSLESQTVQRLGQNLATFRFYACRGWTGNPQPRRRSE